MSTVVLPEKKKVFTDHDATEFMEDSDVDEFSDYDEEDEEEEALPNNEPEANSTEEQQKPTEH